MEGKSDAEGLTLLGNQATTYKTSGPSAAILETFPNPALQNDYWVTHTFTEFTSRCPKTGQPDFGVITVRYIPDRVCVETKSLKLYYFAFREEGAFMERLTNRFLADLVQVCQPRHMVVEGKFASRGGVQTTVTAEYKKSV